MKLTFAPRKQRRKRGEPAPRKPDSKIRHRARALLRRCADYTLVGMHTIPGKLGAQRIELETACGKRIKTTIPIYRAALLPRR